MKSIVIAVTAASALSLPPAAFAQTDSASTRAQVRTELQQLEQAGYDPAKGEDPHYPTDVQSAGARVSAQNGVTTYGGVRSGSSSSGLGAMTHSASMDEMKRFYFGGH
jgi:hypothetical protein